jgi:hypothetical protein
MCHTRLLSFLSYVPKVSLSLCFNPKYRFILNIFSFLEMPSLAVSKACHMYFAQSSVEMGKRISQSDDKRRSRGEKSRGGGRGYRGASNGRVGVNKRKLRVEGCVRLYVLMSKIIMLWKNIIAFSIRSVSRQGCVQQ